MLQASHMKIAFLTQQQLATAAQSRKNRTTPKNACLKHMQGWVTLIVTLFIKKQQPKCGARSPKQTIVIISYNGSSNEQIVSPHVLFYARGAQIVL
jgi:hypothetical protein